MTRDAAWITSLKALANEPRTLDDIVESFTHYKIGDDRAVALLAATEVEDGLLRLLRYNMRSDLNKTEINQLFGTMAPLGSHGTRINLCYALGYFGKITRADLETHRLIRNAFAHSQKIISFETDAIRVACEKLQIIDKAIATYADAEINLGDYESVKDRFVQSCKIINLEFTRRSDTGGLIAAFPEVPLD